MRETNLLFKTFRNFIKALRTFDGEAWGQTFRHPSLLRFVWYSAYEDARWGNTEYWHRY